MCKDDCDHYKGISTGRKKGRFCKDFTGNKKNKLEVLDCRKYCNYYKGLEVKYEYSL